MIGTRRALLTVLFASAIVAAGCTPPKGPRDPDAGVPMGNGQVGAAGGPAGSPIWSSRTSRFGAIASLVLAPTTAATEANRAHSDESGEEARKERKPDEEPEIIVPMTGLRMRTSHVEVGDPGPDGARIVHVESVFEDYTGARTLETRIGRIVDRPDGRRSFRWLGPSQVVPVPPTP